MEYDIAIYTLRHVFEIEKVISFSENVNNELVALFLVPIINFPNKAFTLLFYLSACLASPLGFIMSIRAIDDRSVHKICTGQVITDLSSAVKEV